MPWEELGDLLALDPYEFEDAVAALLREMGLHRVRRTGRSGDLAVLQRLGALYLIVIDDVYSNLFTGEPRVSADLDDDGWRCLIETSRRIGGVAREHGLVPVLHPHAETHVEYEHQIERFLGGVAGEVDLCLDVGHHAYRGGDPVAFIRRHHDRIPYLHLKHVDNDVKRRVETEGMPFAKAVAEDMFVEPAKCVVDFRSLRDALEHVGYDGFGIVEQDMYPAPFDKPYPIAKRTYEYLREIGLG